VVNPLGIPQGDNVRTVGDVSGDGKDDLVGFGLDGVYVATAR